MACKHRAQLIVTRSFEGTASSVAKKRIDLVCSEVEGHAGPHHDRERNERWEDRGPELTHVLRHEDGT
jgi:hypothetical protein